MNTTAATRSNVMPTVKTTSVFDHERLDTKIVKPAAIIKGPKRPGRRHHATSPPSTYASTIHTMSADWTAGSSTWSLENASHTEHPAAAHPATPTAESAAWLGRPVTVGAALSRSVTVTAAR